MNKLPAAFELYERTLIVILTVTIISFKCQRMHLPQAVLISSFLATLIVCLHAILYSVVFINKAHSVSSHQRTLLVINKTEDQFGYINE